MAIQGIGKGRTIKDPLELCFLTHNLEYDDKYLCQGKTSGLACLSGTFNESREAVLGGYFFLCPSLASHPVS